MSATLANYKMTYRRHDAILYHDCLNLPFISVWEFILCIGLLPKGDCTPVIGDVVFFTAMLIA